MIYAKPHGYRFIEDVGCINFSDIQHCLLCCYNGCPHALECNIDERSYCYKYQYTTFCKILLKSDYQINIPYKAFDAFAKQCQSQAVPIYISEIKKYKQ